MFQVEWLQVPGTFLANIAETESLAENAQETEPKEKLVPKIGNWGSTVWF